MQVIVLIFGIGIIMLILTTFFEKAGVKTYSMFINIVGTCIVLLIFLRLLRQLMTNFLKTLW